MDSKITIDKLISSPDFLVYDLETPSMKLLFKEVTELTYSDSTFLDERIIHASGNNYISEIMPLFNALQKNDVPRASPCFIFHTSFCCSTLLARCFDFLPDVFVAKEPWILRRLADLKRRNNMTNELNDKDWKILSYTIYHLLRKSYGEQRIVIKPTNLANNIVDELMSQSINSRAVMIYSSLNDFLISNIKKTSETQSKMPLLAKIFTRDTGGHPNLTLEEIEKLPLLQACIVIWYSQFKLIEQQWSKQYLQRCLFINAEEFLARPQDAISNLCKFFNYGDLPSDQRNRLDSIMGKHSKSSSSYTAKEKKQEDQELARKNKHEINEALQWSKMYFDVSQIEDYLAKVPRVF
ncbi:hypothetical protein CXF85_03850 [Colwellia sp. 75C3]|uniref:hypothetical protein n=1 Tax=Colwellia sp. 75C3 TaxID=888425 RepID=UPI000C34A3B8|nr:hypothetical protein [Colwellia sp. 75C3]PKG85916.1 hypothetical protein CXF85_03850 [Colwellia sp. 75C3]